MKHNTTTQNNNSKPNTTHVKGAQLPSKKKDSKFNSANKNNNANKKAIPNTVFKQLNLQKKKVATTTFMKELKTNQLALIQEPYVIKNKISNIPKSHVCYLGNPSSKNMHRAAIVIPYELSKTAILLNGLSNNDTVVVKSTIAKKCNILLVSMYMDINLETPTKVIHDICTYANKHKMKLLIAMDSNAHNVAWGSKDTNKRGKELLDIIVSENLFIEN